MLHKKILQSVVKSSIVAFIVAPIITLAQGTKQLNNPLGGFSTIDGLLVAVLNVVIIVAMPIVALYIIYAGFMYVAARGNPEKTQEASRALTFGVIGGVIIVGAIAILTMVQSLVAEF